MGILILRYIVMSENQRDPQYKLRWPEDLRDRIMESAKNNNRSINAEICSRLEQSLALSPETHPINMAPEELMDRASQTVAKEVVEELIKILKNDQIKDVKIVLTPSKKAP